MTATATKILTPGPLVWHDVQDVPQRSERWFELRRGKVTGSSCSPLGSTKGKFTDGLSQGAWSLVYRLAAHEIDPEGYQLDCLDEFGNRHTEWGIQCEPIAAREYERQNWCKVHEVGFVEVKGRRAGASPDRMVDHEGGLEIKCLNLPKHLEWCRTQKIDLAHERQIQWCLFVTGFQWWDLVHFNPRAGKKSYHEKRYERNEKLINLFREKLPYLEAAVDREVNETK
jgi:hypothetical protein